MTNRERRWAGEVERERQTESLPYSRAKPGCGASRNCDLSSFLCCDRHSPFALEYKFHVTSKIWLHFQICVRPGLLPILRKNQRENRMSLLYT